MTRSLARLLPLLLSALAFVLVPTSASAADASLLGDLLPRIVGNSALVDASPNKLKAVDLRNGRTTVFPSPTEFVDRFNSVLGHGFLAAIGESFGPSSDPHTELFASGAKGTQTLASWLTDFKLESYNCRGSWYPLGVDARGRVTALQVTLTPTAKLGTCSVKNSGTMLVRFDSNGSKQTLYLPDQYKQWLSTANPFSPRSTFAFRGDRLAMFQVKPHNRVAVLNLRTHTAKEFSPGKKISGVAFASSKSLLVTRQTPTRTVARLFGTDGRADKTIYSGATAAITACGDRTAVGTRTLITIRDRKGKQVYRHVPAASYEDGPYVTCSGSYLYYQFADQGCSHCGPMPSESKLIELGKL